DLRGSLLQIFDLAVSAVMYYPFFKAWERVLVAREEAAELQEESRTAAKAMQLQPVRQNPVDAVGTRKEG
ncbi:MAG: hypothetical protein JO215_01345, partial [Ktedonobacteraceae bacterium]|nr:hypothetical protein [Ktedonobacteraceae bacterium]